MGCGYSGAMDTEAFDRCQFKHQNLPPPSSLAWEGALHDHFFDMGTTKKAVEPAFQLSEMHDPLQGEKETWLSVGVNSCFDGVGLQKKGRLPCNAVFVVDISGSMNGQFVGGDPGSKLAAAKNALRGMVPMLRDDDAVALVEFDVTGNVVHSFQRVGAGTSGLLKAVDSLQARGGTKFTAGFEAALEAVRSASGLLGSSAPWSPLVHSDFPPKLQHVVNTLTAYWTRSRTFHVLPRDVLGRMLSFLDLPSVGSAFGVEGAHDIQRRRFTETRIFFMTDMQITVGCRDSEALLGMIKKAAVDEGIFTTIIGLGISFDVQLTSQLTRARGANHFSVHSTKEFLRRLTVDLDFMMAPLAFDLRIHGEDVEALHDYGAPSDAADRQDEILYINTVFPSPSGAGGTKGNSFLVHLHGPPKPLTFVTTYTTRTGREEVQRHVVYPSDPGTALLKGVAIVKFVNLFRTFLSYYKLPSTPLQAVPHPPTESSLPWRTPDTAYRPAFEALRGYMKDTQQKLADLHDPDFALERWLKKIDELLQVI
eukprot:Sspe_Gene.104045::Locus_79923_Transcript_1_1_Confidence_1.000_Length_1702::g.104045::m.104045